jgi:DNA repair photolyase
VLYANSMNESGDVLNLNLFRGGGDRGAFFSKRASFGYQGEETIDLFARTAEQLDQELSARRPKPRSVRVCPSADPFPPIAEVQAEAARVVDVLARHGVEAWLMTRGYIRPSVLQVLAAHPTRVRVTVAMSTLDRKLQRVLEPLTAPPCLRLRQIAALRRLGIGVQVALEPLVPGLTDTRANLLAVLQELAAAGIGHVTASYLVLRSGSRDNLIRSLEPHGWEALVLDAFAEGPVLQADGIQATRYLPKARRQRGYAALMALAADFGITVCVSRAGNPDFRPGQRPETQPRQRLLPLFEAARRTHIS